MAETALSNLVKSVRAYSPDDMTTIQILERVLEILRRAGADLQDGDRAVRRLQTAYYTDRLDRYQREREKERAGRQSSAVAVADSERDPA